MEKKLNIEYYALLAARIRERDADAFTEFYYATYNDLYRYALYFLKDTHLAQDALHEIYLIIWRSISALKDDRLFHSWSRQIAYHVCCDFQRKYASVSSHETPITDDNESLLDLSDHGECFQEIYRKDFLERMERYLVDLPASQRQAFLLRYEHKLKLEEIADFLGTSLSTAKREIRRARSYLKKKLSQ